MTDHNWSETDVEIDRKGRKIVLPSQPEEMPIPDAIQHLEQKQAELEEVHDFVERINGFPLDAAVAFMKAMRSQFGWARAVKTPPKHMFDSEHPPTLIGVEIGPDETIQVPFGRFKIPNVEGFFETQVAGELVIVGKLPKKFGYIVSELAQLTREILKTDSIYKGKALHVSTNDRGKIDYDDPPSFIDTRTIDPAELILNESVHESVETSIFNPIRHTERCRQHQIPLKRHALLEGIYGVGKTMIARITALECVKHGWTYITVDRAQSLREALKFAKRYAPAVVFCEDIDRVADERDEQTNDLLNTIDGVLSKNTEIITVMTTNHVERIDPSMLRPGRQDAVITVAPPDSKSVQRLLHLYGRGLIAEDENLEAVGHELAGQIPASVREVVERAKLRALPQSVNGDLRITQENLLHSSREMKAHLAFLQPKAKGPTGPELVAKGFNQILQETELSESVIDTEEMVDDISQRLPV